MNHVAYCADSKLPQGRKVATVYRDKHRRWVICWHSRADARERIASLRAAKDWIGQLLIGEVVVWRREK